MKTLIVLVFIAFGEPPKVIDVYQIQPGVYQTCKMKAKELNKSAVNGSLGMFSYEKRGSEIISKKVDFFTIL